MKALENKVAIITGASSGFGAAMATSFAEAGARVVLVSRKPEQLAAMEEKLLAAGGCVVAVPGDVTDPDTFSRVLQVAIERWGRVDILINNAGGGIKIGPIEEQTPESIEQSVALNLTSVMHACRIIVPQMKTQCSGLIINVTSACHKFAWPGWSVYSAAKIGVSMFSRCLYAELRPHGIAVTVLVPGGANTGFQQAACINNSGGELMEQLRPEHIAHAALSVATMPAGGVVPEVVVYGMAQEIMPF